MIVITTHRNTDFDALASVTAGTLLFPGAIPVIPKNVNPNVKAFLSIHKDIFQYYSPDQVELDAVEKIVEIIEEARENLGINKKAERKLLDMKDRRELDV